MDATPPQPVRRTKMRTLVVLVGCALAGLAVAAALDSSAARSTEPGALPEPSCCEESATGAPTAPAPVVPVGAEPPDERQDPPDAIGDAAGGIAARLHTADGRPLPGDVFMLMAVAGSDAAARLYDRTPYTHDNGTAADTYASNVAARETVETITGVDIELLELTTAPAGGPSAGITYTIAYLNKISDGAFTSNLSVAATGRIDRHGYVGPINAVNEKITAAHLADADVLFTPSTPTDERLTTYAARHVGVHGRARNTGTPLADERQLEHYTTWGATRSDGMDVVHVRHIADVAAYLCGTGSTYACHITDLLDDTTTEFTSDHGNGDADTRHVSGPVAAR